MQPRPAALADRREIVRALALLLAPRAIAELYVPAADGTGMLAGLYDDYHALARDAAHLSGRGPAVFVSLNEVDPAARPLVLNRLRARPRLPWDRALAPINRRRWFPIDLDPQRPENTNSTEAEHDAALGRASRIRDWLAGRGWPEPVLADSGNGAHLLYRVDLPDSAETARLIDLGLAALALRFGDRMVAVDASVGDAERLWKLYGTLAAKGPATPARPHRLARVLARPARLTPVPPDAIAALPRSPRPDGQAPEVAPCSTRRYPGTT